MLDPDMISLDREHISYADADRLADLWNAAYPLMRSIATDRIMAYRRSIERKAWVIDPSSPNAEWHRTHALTESEYRRRLKGAEELRLALGQLDRGAHKACTQSPGSFSAGSAYRYVQRVLDGASANMDGLSVVYRLAAVLSEMNDRWLERMRSSRE